MGNFFHSLFTPLVTLMGTVLTLIHNVIPSYGWALIVLALVVRLALFPLSQQQFKSMAEMQKLQPLIKGLQAKYKGDAPKLNTEMMALYKEHKVNPLAGCLPVVLQLPILIALYWAIYERLDQFKAEHFLWIGSALSAQFPKIFASSLATTDMVLLALYVVSMYLSVRYGSPPSTDPQQAQTQKIMAFVSPAMIAYLGIQYHWASALLVYWLAINVFTMGQQLLLYRRYGLIGAKPAPALEGPSAKNVTPSSTNGNGKPNGKNSSPSKNSPNGRAYKRGAKR
ncbi:MAG: hypothetical protein NVSMB64_16340 [Candidatus Velthaea sp.]